MAQNRTRKRAPDVDSAKPLCGAFDAHVRSVFFFVSDQSAGSTDKGPGTPKTTVSTAAGRTTVSLSIQIVFPPPKRAFTGLGLART